MPRRRSRRVLDPRQGVPPCGRRIPLACNFALRSCRVAAALLTLTGGGCMVGPDYEAPAVSTAANYLEANQASVDTKREEYEAWWRVFHDPVLDRLIQTAYNQNLS